MDENLRSEIRSLVHEEMTSNSPNTSSNLPGRNIVAQTRELIRRSVESATTTTANALNHNLRLTSRGKRKASKKIKKTTLEVVCLLRKTSAKEYTIMEQSVIDK